MRTTILRFSVLLVMCVLLCACSSGEGPTTAARTPTRTAAPTEWTPLEQRPLDIPKFAPGAACPMAKGHAVSPSFGQGLGDGPAYPIFGGASDPSNGIFRYAPPKNFDSTDWGGNKVLWAVDTPHYPGIVLVRGRQLDGSNELRFDTGALPSPELQISPYPGTQEGWTGQPSYTRVRAPGCYGYQIDGTTFSKVVIFEAEPES